MTRNDVAALHAIRNLPLVQRTIAARRPLWGSMQLHQDASGVRKVAQRPGIEPLRELATRGSVTTAVHWTRGKGEVSDSKRLVTEAAR